MRKILLVCQMACILASSIAQVPTNGLVGFWPFNGNANDESENGNHGTVYNTSLTLDRFGLANSAYDFNGTSSYIDLPNSDIYNTDRFTVSLWTLLGTSEVITPDLFILTKGNESTGLQWRIYTQGVRPANDSSVVVNDIFTNSGRIITGKPVLTNKWLNIIMVSDSSTLKCYINDTLVSSASISGSINKVNNSFSIGARHVNSVVQNYFIGKIDDIRIYNRDLSQSELKSLYNEGICRQTVFDTIKVMVYDTVHVTVFDTMKVSVTDTLFIDVNLTDLQPPSDVTTIRIYPNPTKDHLFIHTGEFSNITDYSIKIYNPVGTIVFESEINQQEIDINLSDWSGKGIYILKVLDRNESVQAVKKIILQ